MLLPGEEHVYRTGDTLPFDALRAADAFRFVVWGDATDLLEYVVTNAAQIRQLSVPPKFSLFVGDLYDQGFNLTAVEELRNAMDGGANHGLSGTLFPMRGNHDILNLTRPDAVRSVHESYLAAGADIVAPSDMMDGRVAAIRAANGPERKRRHSTFPAE